MSNIREQAVALLIEQYKESPRFIAFLDSLLRETDNIEIVYQQLRDAMDLDKAIGAALDNLGRIVVLERPYQGMPADSIFTFDGPQGGGFWEGKFIGLNTRLNYKISDDFYKVLIRSKILLNVTSCTIDEMLRSLTMVLDMPITLNNGVGYVELVLPRAPTIYEQYLIDSTFPITAGVRLVQTIQTTAPPSTITAGPTTTLTPTTGAPTTTPAPASTTPAPTTLGPTTTPIPTTPIPTTTAPTTLTPTTEAPSGGSLYYVKIGGTRSSGVSVAGNWTNANCYGNIATAIQHMAGGDECVVDSGTYTGINNVIGRYNYWAVPSGTSSRSTKIRARYPFQATIDSGTGFGYYDMMMYLGGSTSYIHVDGFRGINRSGANRAFMGAYGSNLKITRCQVRTTGAANIENSVVIAGGNCNRVLFEDCAVVGNYRYGFKVEGVSSAPHNVIFRRCVGRPDYTDTEEPFAMFAVYGHNSDAGSGPYNIIFQNCIALDQNASVPDAAWKAYAPLYIFKGHHDTVVQSCIFLNNDQTGTESGSWITMDSGGYNIQVLNNIFYGFNNGALTLSGGITLVEGNTFGDTTTYGVRFNSFPSGAPFRNNLFLPSGTDNKTGTVSTASYNSFAAGTSFGTNNLPYQDDCTHLPRVNDDSNRKGGGYQGGYNQGNVGAHIVYRQGVDGSFYGDTGWNSLTDDLLWPFPYEAEIKEFFSVVNNPPAGASPSTNNTTRGFCATSQTLTDYIWEYLGNPTPVDFDDSD